MSSYRTKTYMTFGQLANVWDILERERKQAVVALEWDLKLCEAQAIIRDVMEEMGTAMKEDARTVGEDEDPFRDFLDIRGLI